MELWYAIKHTEQQSGNNDEFKIDLKNITDEIEDIERYSIFINSYLILILAEKLTEFELHVLFTEKTSSLYCCFKFSAKYPPAILIQMISERNGIRHCIRLFN